MAPKALSSVALNTALLEHIFVCFNYLNLSPITDSYPLHPICPTILYLHPFSLCCRQGWGTSDRTQWQGKADCYHLPYSSCGFSEILLFGDFPAGFAVPVLSGADFKH